MKLYKVSRVRLTELLITINICRLMIIREISLFTGLRVIVDRIKNCVGNPEHTVEGVIKHISLGALMLYGNSRKGEGSHRLMVPS